MTVEEQLRALREAEQHVAPPSRLEARLMQAFDAAAAIDAETAPPSAALMSRRRWLGGLAVAATVALAAGGAYLNRAPAQSAPTPASPAQAVESVVLTVEPPGVEETVRVVRMRVAPSTLKGLGIESDRIPLGETLVDVDVLVGEDGVARGVRLGL
jgi:hypothetical protein